MRTLGLCLLCAYACIDSKSIPFKIQCINAHLTEIFHIFFNASLVGERKTRKVLFRRLHVFSTKHVIDLNLRSV